MANELDPGGTMEIFFSLFSFAVPLASFLMVARRQGATRGQALAASSAGGAVVGVAAMISLGLDGLPLGNGWPLILVGTASGFVVGLVALLLRNRKSWLSGPP